MPNAVLHFSTAPNFSLSHAHMTSILSTVFYRGPKSPECKAWQVIKRGASFQFQCFAFRLPWLHYSPAIQQQQLVKVLDLNKD